MKLQTHRKEIVNPNISHIKSAMHEVESSPDEGFVILEKDDGTFIQGLYVKGASDIRLAGVDITKDWYIEKRVGSYECYCTNLPSEKAQEVFIKFCEEVDWKNLAKWKHVFEKEYMLQLTSEEKEALLEVIEVMLETVDDSDFRRWAVELREDVVGRGVVGEGHILPLGGYLSGYLEGYKKKPKALEGIYAKCKKYDSNIP